MNDAVHSAADTARAQTAAAPVPQRREPGRDLRARSPTSRTSTRPPTWSKIYEVAHPLADVLDPSGVAELASMLQLKDAIETLYLDKVAGAFRWPLYVAALFALIAAPAGWLLGRRLGSDTRGDSRAGASEARV